MHFIKHIFVTLLLMIMLSLSSISFAQSITGGGGSDKDQIYHLGGTLSFEELQREFGGIGNTSRQLLDYVLANPGYSDDWSDAKVARFATYSSVLVRKSGMSAQEIIAFNNIQHKGIFDTVVDQFQQNGMLWQVTFIKYAEWLFWALFAISFTIQMCYSFLEGGEIRSVFSQLVKFTIWCGIAIFILRNGATMAGAIFKSLQQIGVEAGGIAMSATTPSGIVDIGMDIFTNVLADTSWGDIALSVTRVGLALLNMFVLAYVAIRFAMLIIMGWMLAFIGIMTLGLAGLDQTKDVIGNYMKTIIGYGLEMMTFLLVVGVVFNISSVAMSGASTPGDLGLSVLASLVMAFLTQSLPSSISALVTGSTIHSGSNAANAAKGLATSGAALAGGMVGGLVGAGLSKAAGAASDKVQSALGMGKYSGSKIGKQAIKDDKAQNRANKWLEKKGRGDLSSGGGGATSGSDGNDKNNTFSG